MDEQQDAGASWAEYRRLVISELTRIDRGVKGLHEKIDARDAATDKQISDMKTSIALLQLKSASISAGISAAVGIITALVAAYISSRGN